MECVCSTNPNFSLFCSAKDGQCDFDSRLYDFRLYDSRLYKEKTSAKTEVFLLVEMAETEASLRSFASQTFRIYMSLLLRKRWTMRFRFPLIKEKPRIKPRFSFGGDGGNRNRVRKHIPANFYERSRSFLIPLSKRRAAGFKTR